IERLEGAGAALMFGVFRLLPLDLASALGGWLGRAIGRRLGITRRARTNLRRAMPDLDQAAIDRIIRGMWDNLGRVVAEYPHLGAFQVYAEQDRIELRGGAHMDAAIAAGKPIIAFSGHFGNWEVATLSLTQRGLSV